MLVTCVCITADRPEFTEQAVECYLAQTYPHKRLLIFDTSAKVPTQCHQHHGLFHWYEPRRPGDTIGALRNRANHFAIDMFHPDLLAHWDSDDHSIPGRLKDQANRIATSGKACTGYHSMKFTDGDKWWMYHGAPQFALGTSLMYRGSWWESHPFHLVNVGEDNAFGADAWKAGQMAISDSNDLMWARIHAGNSSKKVIAGNWEPLQ